MVEEYSCPVCGEVAGGYFNVRGAKLHIPKNCRCVREQIDREKAEHKADLEERREKNRVDAIAECVARIKTDTPEPHKGFGLSEQVKPFVEKFTGKEWLSLHGAVGTGKTTQAWAAAVELAKRGHLLAPADTPTGWYLVHFASWDIVHWLNVVRESYDNDEAAPDLVFPRLLILDDLGAERIRRDKDGDSWVREQVHALLSQRWLKRKPTILTSNLRPAEICNRLDERIADRIFDTRLTTVVTLTGESWRRKERQ